MAPLPRLTRRAGTRIGLAAALWAAATGVALACPICFQVEAGPVTDGVRAAVLVLLAVTVGVLAGFGRFITGFVRRARALERSAPRPKAEAGS